MNTPFLKGTLLFGLAGAILFLGVMVFFLHTYGATDPGAFASDRAALEAQLGELEKEIIAHEATIAQYKKQGKTLQGEIGRLNTQIGKLNLQIKAVTLNLQKLDQEIATTQGKIGETQSEIGTNKKNLISILQTVYERDGQGLMEVFLEHNALSDFFSDLNSLLSVQDTLAGTLEHIIGLREQLVLRNTELAEKRSDVAALKVFHDAQKTTVQKTQSEKNTLLKITKGKESEYQKILTETKKTAAEIRKQIFKLFGGGELNFEDAYKFAKFAEEVTGVRAALILAVLDRESALGQNVGRCSYRTAMHPRRDIPIFLTLTAELGLDPSSMMVSCANADGAYGGAMGPAQFIPSTWNLYKSRVAEITGNNPPSPWRNADAFIATALYLKDAGAATNERTAAARYYCGSNWNRYVCTSVYGKKVVTQAAKFQDDIDILNS